MAVTVLNFLEHVIGDTFLGATFHMKEYVDGQLVPIDLTNAKIRIDVRSNSTSALVMRFTNYVSDSPPGVPGEMSLEIIDPATNGDWRIKPLILRPPPGTYVHEAEITWPGDPDTVITFFRGSWAFTQDTAHD